MNDNELGTFLRTRREAVTPAEVGLPTGSRRRTPGLRRAELATLADISVEYLTRLEQGRDRNPSPQVLAALGDALQGYERYAGPLGLLDGDPPNMVRYLFTDARARAAYPGWDRLADEQVAHLLHETSLHDPHVTALAEELKAAGPSFGDRLSAAPAPPTRFGTELVDHPEAGRLRLSYETLALPDEGQRLVVHIPADEATAPRSTDSTAAGQEPCGR